MGVLFSLNNIKIMMSSIEEEIITTTTMTTTTNPEKTKKAPRKRKVINVIYMNDLPTEVVVKTLKQKIEEKYLQ